jgi:hypothetical protein
VADRIFMELTRAEQDEPAAYQRALEHYRNRALPAFQSNNAAALAVTGPYTPDPKYLAEVQAMPARGVERALERERMAFNEAQLREYVELIQSRPENVLDSEALARWTTAQQAYARKWNDADPTKASRDALFALRMWGLNGNDDDLRASVEKRWALLIEQRATTLRTAFHRAPQLLEDAMEYYRLLGDDHPDLDGKLAAIRSQAHDLAEQAQAQQRYTLAADYYGVAGEDTKAEAARALLQQSEMRELQPSIDEARRQADALAERFGDPAQVDAMRQQAEAARRNLAQQAPSVESRRKSAEDLERELGL